MQDDNYKTINPLIQDYLYAVLDVKIANPVRERLLFWIATNGVRLGAPMELSLSSFVTFTIERLNAGPLNIGQAIAFIEAQQAAELIYRRAIFLATPGANPYLPEPK
jgi:hypothetical protein